MVKTHRLPRRDGPFRCIEVDEKLVVARASWSKQLDGLTLSPLGHMTDAWEYRSI
jgi:hypothetical protein